MDVTPLRFYVKPVVEVVRFPGTNLQLAAEGDYVPNDKYWRNRIRDNDVELAEPPAIVEPEAAAPAPAADLPASQE